MEYEAMTTANGEESGGAARKLNKVMVFFDGTWCGQLTGTRTNVKILADAVAGKSVNGGEPFVVSDAGIVGCYYDGEGVEGGFSDYLLDGALGGRIREDCLGAYRLLMDEFERTDGQCEAWLIGLSRGSYTVRCVAGMINNCGLISRKVVAARLSALGHGAPSEQDMDDIIQRAYSYYRDRSDTYKPNSDYMKQWKRDHSRVTKRPPVKFMGLFETVGSLGIPSLDPGVGVDYHGNLNFYGKADEGASAVSGEVERVYQALAVHDRLTPFGPCHVKRDSLEKDFSYNKNSHLQITYKTKELWFPGAHYDIGRQKFMFYKSPKLLNRASLREFSKCLVERAVTFSLTRLLRIPDISPNYEYSEAVLTWIAEKMAKTDRDVFGTIPEVVASERMAEQDSWTQTLFDWLTLKPSPLSNDAYDHLTNKSYLSLGLVPFAHRFIVALFNRYILMDRTIVDPPDAQPPAPPVKFFRAPQRPGVDPDVELKASTSYRSRSFNSYILEKELRTTRLRG